MSSSHLSPLCTFCKSAGRPESEYSSHFVKDKPGPYGIVVCPLLLHHQCSYCLLLGHTPKFCPSPQARDDHQKAPQKRTPFCAVCRDAGRPESEYTSHFVKDQPGPNGKVICPLLLKQKCRYCKECGHTPSQCPKLQLKKMYDSLMRNETSYHSSNSDWGCSANQRRTILQLEERSSLMTKKNVPRPRLTSANLKPRVFHIAEIHFDRRHHNPDWSWLDVEITPDEEKEAFKVTNSLKMKTTQSKRGRRNLTKMYDGITEEEVHQCLFPQTLYSLIEETLSMDEADKEFEYLKGLDNMPKIVDALSSSDDDEDVNKPPLPRLNFNTHPFSCM